jgi:hypothetical protein
MTPVLEKLLAAWPAPKIPEAQFIDWLLWALARNEATGAIPMPTDLKQHVLTEIEKFAREGELYQPRYMPVTDESSYDTYCQEARESCRAVAEKLAAGTLTLGISSDR